MLAWHNLLQPSAAAINTLHCTVTRLLCHQPLACVWQEARLQQQSEEVKQQLQESQHSAAAAELLHASAVARHLKTLEAKEVQPHPFPPPPPPSPFPLSAVMYTNASQTKLRHPTLCVLQPATLRVAQACSPCSLCSSQVWCATHKDCLCVRKSG